jgi:hypothetical protein
MDRRKVISRMKVLSLSCKFCIAIFLGSMIDELRRDSIELAVHDRLRA